MMQLHCLSQSDALFFVSNRVTCYASYNGVVTLMCLLYSLYNLFGENIPPLNGLLRADVFHEM